MEIIDEEQLKEALKEAKENPETVRVGGDFFITREEIEKYKEKLNRPIEEMKDIAAKLKAYIDERMKLEYSQKGYLSSATRQWLKDYNDLLSTIQKAIYGEKSTTMHSGKITHSHIASLIRQYEDISPNKEPEEITIQKGRFGKEENKD